MFLAFFTLVFVVGEVAGFFVNFGEADNSVVNGFEMARYDQESLISNPGHILIFLLHKFDQTFFQG